MGAGGFAVSKAVNPLALPFGSSQPFYRDAGCIRCFYFYWVLPVNNFEWVITSLRYLLVMVRFLGTGVPCCVVDWEEIKNTIVRGSQEGRCGGKRLNCSLQKAGGLASAIQSLNTEHLLCTGQHIQAQGPRTRTLAALYSFIFFVVAV